MYSIESLERYSPAPSLYHHYYDPYPSFFNHDNQLCDYIKLNRHTLSNDKKDKYPNSLSLNLNHEITIFKNFIMVHKTDDIANDDENEIFERMNYFVANGHECNACLLYTSDAADE